MGVPRRTCLALLPAACGDKPPPAPPRLVLEMTCGADQNPDAGGTATPAAVQFYPRASTARFEPADVFALTGRERETLGPDSLGSAQLLLAPVKGGSWTRPPGRSPGRGGVVLFRAMDMGATGRAVAPIAAVRPTGWRRAPNATG